MEFAVGFDVGGTLTKVAVVERSGSTVAAGRVPTRADRGPRELVARCLEEATRLCTGGRRLRDAVGVGVGVAGLVDVRRGTLATAPNLPGWEEVPIGQLFAGGARLPVHVDNDATLCALGEALAGAGRGHDVVVALTLGTGVGGGIIDHGRIVHGARGMAAEFGHLALAHDGGPACACGQRGCLEAYVCAQAVVERVRAWARRHPGEPAGSLAAALRRGRLTAAAVGRAAAAGDPVALRVFEETGRYLGAGIAQLITALNPDAVVVGGGVALAGPPLMEPARRAALARVMPPLAEAVSILPAALADRGGVLGAALLALGATTSPAPGPAGSAAAVDDRPAPGRPRAAPDADASIPPARPSDSE